ncbi:MAG: hypothetical protein KDI01_12115, partial [Halioglobus sp.]|nr:hypothetical protein [Halioglobus sp.]
YSKENEHTLTAYILACGGWIMKEGPFSKHDSIAYMLSRSFPHIANMMSIPEGTMSESDLNELLNEMKRVNEGVNPFHGSGRSRDPLSSRRGSMSRKNIGTNYRGSMNGFRRRTF